MRTADSRTEPTKSVPMRAVNDSAERVGDLLAQTIGRFGIAARPERAFVQPLDRRSVARRLGNDGERNIVHRVAA